MAKKKIKSVKTAPWKKVAVIAVVIVALAAIGILTGSAISASSVCGNKVCEVGENIGNCLEDCVSLCGDAVCHEGETLTCAQDCTGNYTMAEPEDVSLLDGILAWFM